MDERDYPALTGRRILIVEDEPMIAMTLEDMLRDLGCEVAGTAKQVAGALHLIEANTMDGAVLDVNLGAEKIDAVADELVRRGCPFIFTTGYGQTGVPIAHQKRGVVQKPFRLDDLAQTLAAAFAS
jgi:CheY-like chemotaxis protein